MMMAQRSYESLDMREIDGRGAIEVYRHRSVTVKAKLRNAFIGIAAFSMLAAIVGMVSYEAVGVAQENILEKALPAARHVELLVQEGVNAVSITSALLAAADDAAVVLQRQRIEAMEHEMGIQLPQLPEIESIDAEIAQFKIIAGNIFDTLRVQAALVEDRNATLAKRDLLASRIVEEGRAIVEILRPAIIEANTQTFVATDRIREHLKTGGSGDVIDQFDRLMDIDVQSVQRLTGIRDQARNLIGDIEALLLNDQLKSTAFVQRQLNSHLRALGRMTLDTRDQELRSAIGKRLGVIAKSSRGPDNILLQQTAYLEALAELGRLEEQSRDARERLGIVGVALKRGVDETISVSTARAKEAVWYGRFSLAAIALLAFLSAVWVIWRYVLSDVAARLDRIAAITRRLARGDLDVTVDVQGTDELGEVADAMRLFKENAIELRRSNADLEQFAYVASHDLKAPLRGISNLAIWIEEDIGDQITGETKKHLDLLKNRIRRLSALLEDLLQYSRAGKQKTETRSVNLNTDLPEIFRLVSATDKFSLELSTPMPTLETAAAPLEQIFRNLISNAIKHHDRSSGTIRVDCIHLGDRFEFTVTDDGPGIAPEYQERIFGMFQTIRARDEVEGSGIGLSIAKKLVESVGCKAWVDSNPSLERGSSIHFTWPLHWPKALLSSVG